MKSIIAILSRLRFRHIKFTLIGVTVALSELIFRLPIFSGRRRHVPSGLDWGLGLSVIIPHHSGAEMLEQCLVSLGLAIDRVKEPTEIIVVVNGSAEEKYSRLRTLYPNVHWLFFAQPLGFTGAVLKGIDKAQHGAIYLLNDDMVLEPEALTTSMSWRGPQFFGVASQIFLQDSERRREETGWTAMPFSNGLPMPRHEVPLGPQARGTVWAGAGSALYHAGLLRELMPGCKPFDPFYWEDVDLGVRAWRLGYESLICPSSVAWHKHRATVEKIYAAQEVNRIFERNRLLFQIRNPFPPQSLGDTLQHLARLDSKTLSELGSWRKCLDLWFVRWAAFRAPNRDIDYPEMWTRMHQRPRPPAVVMVSPFIVLPPVHGGAIRTHRLAVELAKHFDVILVSDEQVLYGTLNEQDCAPFSAIRLVGGRPAEPIGQEASRIARIQSHSHRRLKNELSRVVDLYQPVAVVVEHMELGGLIDIMPAVDRPKFILDLHDVLLSPGDPLQADADSFESALMKRFDGVLVSSAEDQLLIEDCASRIIPNGCNIDFTRDYTPSRGNRSILISGPFRAPINWHGILDFTERIYPSIEAAVKGVSLTILGGKGALQMAASHPCFAKSSITILEYVEDVFPLLESCALTINPQAELRGSSIKVIESLSAGRVCVSTRTGARGWLDSNFKGLVVVDREEDFAAQLIGLLTNEDQRIAKEVPENAKLKAYSWEAAGEELRAYLCGIVDAAAPQRPS